MGSDQAAGDASRRDPPSSHKDVSSPRGGRLVGRVGNGGILISGLNGENRVIGVRVEDRYCGQGIGEAMRDIEMMGEWRDHNERMDKADEETEYRDERIYRLLD